MIPASQMASQHVTDPASARRALGADIAMTGSLAVSGDNVRVVLSSVNASTTKVLKSEVVQGSENDLPELSREMAQTASAMLGLRASDSSTTSDPLADLSPGDVNTYLASLGYLERWDKSASLDSAIAGLDRVIKDSPKFAMGYAALADCEQRRYSTTKDPHALELADQAISSAIQIRGDLPAVNLSHGEVRLLEGKYSDAVADFERVLTLDDRSDRAYRGLANAYGAMGLPDKAEQTWQRAVALRPNSADDRNQWARFELNRGNYAKAAEEFRKAVNIAPENVKLHEQPGRGSALRRLPR